MILEAKREGEYFEVPAGKTSLTYSIKSLSRGNTALKNALEQVAGYCQNRGVPIGAFSNGYQLLAFVRAEKGTRYPLCIEGERACPPEDVGGIYGYQQYLEALFDPKHERHDEFMEWSGPFDSEEFDGKAATKEMRRGLPNWREME